MHKANLGNAPAMLDRITPLRYDCGRLCNAACCKGDGEIWLLPGEEAFYENRPGFTVKRYQNDGKKDSFHVICHENCWLSRETRPFFCKIFPLFPLVTVDAYQRIRIQIILDPRSRSICPLFEKSHLITPRFRRTLRLAVRALCRDPEILAFFVEAGAFLMEMEAFRRRLSTFALSHKLSE